MGKINKYQALELLAQSILDNAVEKMDYIRFCDENGVNERDLQGGLQSTHPYALALIGLDLEFELYE